MGHLPPDNTADQETNGGAGEAIATDVKQNPAQFICVDPELLPYAQQQAEFPPLSSENLDFVRKSLKIYERLPLGIPDVDVAVEKRTIEVPGAPDVDVYLINTTPGASKPVIVHTHGGGFVLGDAEDELPNLRFFAAELDCAIVTVDFRIAPEATFEQSIEENYAALRWVHKNAAQIGVDPKRIAIMGESGGGGHAALLALTARDRGEVPVILQVLIYPMLDDRTGSTRHPPFPIGSLVWPAESNSFGWRSFLGQEPGTNDVPVKGVPARYPDLAGLPPTFIAVGQTDLFVEENVEYARRLITAAVPTELHVYPRAYHGFDFVAPQSRLAQDILAARLTALRRAFAEAA